MALRHFDDDSLVSPKTVAELTDYCTRQIDRFVKEPAYAHLAFPQPVYIGARRRWRYGDIIAWNRGRLAAAISARPKAPARSTLTPAE